VDSINQTEEHSKRSEECEKQAPARKLSWKVIEAYLIDARAARHSEVTNKLWFDK
jgi:hypothetical protein